MCSKLVSYFQISIDSFLNIKKFLANAKEPNLSLKPSDSGLQVELSENFDIKKKSSSLMDLNEETSLSCDCDTEIVSLKSKNTKKIVFNRNTTFSLIDTFYKSIYSNFTDYSIIKNNEIVINDDELKILRLTWMFIQDDIQKVGVMIFMKSFETLPEMKDTFQEFKDMTSEDLIKSHTLRTHSRKVMNIVEMVMRNYDIDFEKNKNDLIALGKRHQIYGATDQFLYIMEKQFINSIKPIIAKIFIHHIGNDQFDKQTLQLTELNKLLIKLYDDGTANNGEEVKLNSILFLWHRVFSIINKYMSQGLNDKS